VVVFRLLAEQKQSKGIVEGAAPIPSETMSREVSAFLAQLRGLICTAIREAGGRLELPEMLPVEGVEESAH
jgi:hypothetical protein